METFISNKTGRIIVLSLAKDDKILECVEQAVKENNIVNGVILSGIATLKNFHYHRIATTEDYPTNEYLKVEGPMEVGSIDGMIIDGKPHLHITVQDLERTYVAHLEDSSQVMYLAEICIMEIFELNCSRKQNQFGVNILTKK